jgi:type I restriction enzyme S subunit
MTNMKLKTGWKVWRFDQMATNVNVRIDNPSESGMEHYVGLEHLDPDSLRIRRWGSPDDVEATKLMFKKGDIIFGRRRAYQRKLGVAEFDGICSAHAMVLRAKPEVVLPEFLPFFMQSDLYMNRAVEISVGSLSPTINWKTMAIQEFALPPMEEQKSLVQLLQTTMACSGAHEDALSTAQQVIQAFKDNYLDLCGADECQNYLLGDLLAGSPDSGCSAPPRDADTGHYVLGLAALSRNGYKSGDFKPVDPTSTMLAAKLAKGDLLISRSNTAERVGYAGIFHDSRNDVSFPDTMMRLKPNVELIEPQFLEALLQTSAAREFIMRIAAGTSASMKKINRANLLKLSLKIPPLGHQKEIVRELNVMKDAVALQKNRLLSLRQLSVKLATESLQGS